MPHSPNERTNLGVGRATLAITVIGAIAVSVSVVLGLAVGTHSVSLGAAFAGDGLDHDIVWNLRLPRVVLSIVVGGGLAATGAALQALFRNALAEPYVLGTSGGAAVGGSIAIASGLAAFPLAVHSAAFAGAVGATLLATAAARRLQDDRGETTLLVGVVLNAFASALVSVIKVLVDRAQATELLHWLVGSIGVERWSLVITATVWISIGLLGLWVLSPRVNVLQLGDEAASHLGLSVGGLRAWTIITCSFVVAGAISVAGLVGFVGLVVPHAARRIVGGDARLTIPASFFLGAAGIVAADALSRALVPVLGGEIPIGVVTAAIGCPLFVVLLVRSRTSA